MTLFIESDSHLQIDVKAAHGFGAFHEKNCYKRKNAQMLLLRWRRGNSQVVFAVKSEGIVLNKGESHVGRVD
ncbi:hypothetical protein IGI84_002954 [Enterococcus sp. DIV0008]